MVHTLRMPQLWEIVNAPSGDFGRESPQPEAPAADKKSEIIFILMFRAWFTSLGAKVTLFAMHGLAVSATKDFRARCSGQVAEGFTPRSVTLV